MQNIDLTKLESKNIFNTDYTDKNVLIRTCLNVAINEEGKITDSTRIDESFPTLKQLGEKAKRIVMMAHLGRPTTARESEFSLEPVRVELEHRLGEKVVMLSNYENIDNFLNNSIEPSKYYLIENIRYFEGEETKDENKKNEFAHYLSRLGEIYVNDAFADYREAASTYDVAKLLPSYLGPVFIKEIKAISYFTNPIRPFIAVLGGAKLSEKLDAMLALTKSADKVLVGGAMAYTLLLSQDVSVGKSLIETDKLEVAKQIMNDYKDKIILPLDHIISNEFNEESISSVNDNQSIPDNMLAIDIGPKTQEMFVNLIKDAKSILWNGPMGVFEWESGIQGTKVIGSAITENVESYKFAGGGDSISAINKLELNGFNHVSTGGGAMLAFVSYDKFPTLDIILSQN